MRPIDRSKAKNTRDLRQLLQLSEERLQALIKLSSDFYWEQDETYRFTVFEASNSKNARMDVRDFVGKTLWDSGANPVANGGSWSTHKSELESRRTFNELLYTCVDPQGKARVISSSGQPVFNAEGHFK